MDVHELHNNYTPVAVLAPVAAAPTGDTAMATGIIDMQDCFGVEFYIITGTLEDSNATFAVTLQHGDAVDSVTTPTTITDSAEVVAADGVLIGTLAGVSFTKDADSAVKRIGYAAQKGAGKRWVRLTVTPTGNSGNSPLAVMALKMPLTMPVA